MRCAQDIFNRISEEKSMTKKWLYSVAVGALLIAGEALGITVHDVLSNGFWSAEQRGTHEYLDEATGHHAKTISIKTKVITGMASLIWMEKGPNLNGIKWKGKFWANSCTSGSALHGDYKEKLTATRNKTHKEKTWTYEQISAKNMHVPGSIEDTNIVMNSSATYTVKSLKKGARPMGPLVVDDWFSDSIEKTWGVDGRFYGTEEHAVTNIVSDNEAYITRTVEQTGYLDKYFYGYPINEDASLLRTYNTHITTDDDHVYVDQTICENSTNNPEYNQQDAYQTQYIATFKDGRWRESTETITHTSNQQAADWYLNYLKQKQTTRVSSHQPDHWTMNQRPRQNSR